MGNYKKNPQIMPIKRLPTTPQGSLDLLLSDDAAIRKVLARHLVGQAAEKFVFVFLFMFVFLFVLARHLVG